MTSGPKQEELFEALCRATEQVFTTMLNLGIEVSQPAFEYDFPEHFDGVLSFVGMAGCGRVPAAFPAAQFAPAVLPPVS